MYPPQPMQMQMQMQPQRQFGVRDFFTGIIYIIIGVAILIGFFALPFLNVSNMTGAIDVSGIIDTSASRIVSETTNAQTVEQLSRLLGDARALATLAPYYALYTFIAIAVLYFLGALSAILKAIFRGGKGIGLFSGIFRIIIVPIFYILLPLAVVIAFYAFALGIYDPVRIIENPRLFRLDTIQPVINIVPPGTGMILMVGGSIFGAIITILSTIIGMFTRSTPQIIMMQQPAYGMPAQYGQPQQPPYGQYPPRNPYGAPPPSQTPPYQQPPVQNPYGGNQPPQNPYGAPPPSQTPPYQQPPIQKPYGGNQPPQNPYGTPPPQYPPSNQPQNPIDWGKKRGDDDF